MKTQRDIVVIDEEKCNGCGQCVDACAEGAIQIVDGVARLISESYCDGLGACLGECPQDAITIEQHKADAFDEAAVEAHLSAKAEPAAEKSCPSGECPGSALRSFAAKQPGGDVPDDVPASCLGQWPVQLMLVPPTAPFLKGADLIICADCVPFAVADFHKRYLDGRAVLVGCPKLDDLTYYRAKLAEVFARAKPGSVTVLRMEVPCCAGLANAVIEARDEAAPDLPVEVHVVGIQQGIRKQTVPGRSAARG